MLRSVQFPMELRSENRIRGQHWAVLKKKRDEQKGAVALFLRQLPPVKRVFEGGAHNVFAVTLIRVAPGDGLDLDNLVGACKSARDAVAKWMGFHDDADPRLSFLYRQQRCRMRSGKAGFYCRIEIRDLEPGGQVIKVLGEAPAELGAEAEQNPPPLPKKGAKPPLPTSIQPRLPVRTAWREVPWEPGEIEELPQYAGVDVPPASIRVDVPEGWTPATLRGFACQPGEAPTLTLYRTEFRHPEAGLIWLYRPWRPGLVSTAANTR